MRISQRGLYALQALTVLAQHPTGVVKIKDIAAEEDLPEKFLEAILLDLKRARIVDSLRGANGGYQLKRPAKKIFAGRSDPQNRWPPGPVRGRRIPASARERRSEAPPAIPHFAGRSQRHGKNPRPYLALRPVL